MTFTYSGDPSTSTRNYVRFLIHDTDSTDALFSDEELNYVISEWGGDAYKAARECAEILIALKALEIFLYQNRFLQRLPTIKSWLITFS
ncbi:MAG: hypothetical protein EBZ61_10335 [Micrococcales bacterium]|nr:hypothetical protein [Micrococcales bacterium]